MILAEDEIGLGSDHDGIMLLPDGIEPGTPLARRPSGDRAGARLHDDDEPRRPALDGRAGTRGRDAVRRRAAPDRGRRPAITRSRRVDVTIDEPDGVSALHRARAPGVSVGPSPMWLRARLHAAGMRSISNVVDITNYVMHVYGSPLHAFDRSKLDGGGILVRRAAAGEELTTLDGTLQEARRARPPDHGRAEGGCPRRDHGWPRQRDLRHDDGGPARGRELRADRDPRRPPSGSACVPKGRTGGRRASTRTWPSPRRSSRVACSSISPVPSSTGARTSTRGLPERPRCAGFVPSERTGSSGSTIEPVGATLDPRAARASRSTATGT